MKKFYLFFAIFCLITTPASGRDLPCTRASCIRANTGDFDNNLSGTDTTVQKALETLDEVVGGAGYWTQVTSPPAAFQYITPTTATDEIMFSAADGFYVQWGGYPEIVWETGDFVHYNTDSQLWLWGIASTSEYSFSATAFNAYSNSITTTGLATFGSLVVDSNTINLSDTTDEYVLAFDTATQTWRGVELAGGGDVTGVGDCASGDCGDGSSDGGGYIRLYDGDSHYGQLDVENLSDNRIITIPNAAGIIGLLDDTKGNGDTSYVWSADKSFDQFALKAPLDSPTFTTKMTLNYATASELVATNASKELVSLAVATYPSLAELAYVKGVTSAIQTQLTAGKLEPICHTLETPADADNFLFHKMDRAATITSIECLVNAATSAVIIMQECDANGANCAGVDGATAITCATTNTADDGTLSNAAVDDNDWLRLDIGTVTGTVGHVSVCINF